MGVLISDQWVFGFKIDCFWSLEVSSRNFRSKFWIEISDRSLRSKFPNEVSTKQTPLSAWYQQFPSTSHPNHCQYNQQRNRKTTQLFSIQLITFGTPIKFSLCINSPKVGQRLWGVLRKRAELISCLHWLEVSSLSCFRYSESEQ
jgi:hypothetical protein